MSEIVCQVGNQADQVEFIWSSHGGYFKPYVVAGTQLTELRQAAEHSSTGPSIFEKPSCRDMLERLVFALNQAGEDPPPWDTSFELAEAGFRLYNNLFPQADDTARKVRRWLEDLRKQSGLISLEIVLEELAADPREFLSVPWNLVYDERPTKAAFQKAQGTERWRPFWSVRYNLTSGRRVDPLKRVPLWSDPRVIVVIDPTVHKSLHDDQRERLDQFLLEAGLTAVGSMDELREAMEAGYPRLLYWLGHTTDDFRLRLGDEKVAPADLKSLLSGFDDRERPEGMLAFLNACQTAEARPGGSFLESLHHTFGFTGAIVTERQTIDNFANEFGLDFLQGFLREGKPLGELLHELRLKSAPLGLLYGAHCPPEIQVRLGNGTAVSPAPLPIRESGPVSGVPLGVATLPDVVRDAATAERNWVAPRPTATVSPLPETPYRSLAFYDSKDRALFTGRDADVVRFAATLDRPDTRILVLHGESGTGKSSFLRAGVIPYLEEECVGYRFLRRADGSARIIQPAKDLLGMAAENLLDATARTLHFDTPQGEQETVNLRLVLDDAVGAPADFDTLREALRRDSQLFAEILARIAARLPYALVVVFDQIEEVFTLAKTPEEVASRDHALRMLQRVVDVRADVKLIISLRTEYYGRLLDHLRAGRRDLTGVRDDLLRDFSRSALIEAITRPTADTPLAVGHTSPRAKYGFRYAEGIPEAIADGVLALRSENQDSVLPLAQVICTQLYERKKAQPGSDGVITREDLDAIKGVEGGLKAFAEDALVRSMCLGPADREAFKELFCQLYNRQPDGTLTTWLMPRKSLEDQWDRPTSFGDMLEAAKAVRLLREDELRIEGSEQRRYIRLGHDALANIAAAWKVELEENQRLEKERTERLEERRKRLKQRRRLAGFAVFSVIVAGLFGLLGLKANHEASHALIAENRANDLARLATTAQRIADSKALEYQLMSAKLAVERGLTLCEDGQLSAGMLWLARSLEFCPESSSDLRRVIRTNLAAWSRRLPELESVMHHDAGVRAVAFSPDGQIALTGGYDGTARLWDLTSAGSASVPIEFKYDGEVYCVAFDNRGERFAIGGKGGVAKVYEVRTHNLIETIVPHKSVGKSGTSLLALRFSPDGKRLAMGGVSRQAFVWDFESRKFALTNMNHDGIITDISFIGPSIITACWDGYIRLWDASSGSALSEPQLAHKAGVRSIAVSQDGCHALSGGMDGLVRLWSVGPNATLKCDQEFRHHRGSVMCVALSPDGKHIVSGGADSTARIVEVSSGKPIVSALRHQGWVPAVAFHPDFPRLRQVMTGSGDRTARLTTLVDVPGPRKTLAHKGIVRGAVFTPEAKSVFTGSEDGIVRLWDLESSSVRREFKPFAIDSRGLAITPDGGKAIVGCSDGVARVWETTSGTIIREFKHQDAIQGCVFDNQGRMALTFCLDHTAWIWDLSTGQPVCPELQHDLVVSAGAFTPDGRRVLTGDFVGKAQFWDVATGARDGRPLLHPGTIYWVSISPDGRYALTAGEGSVALLWDIANSSKLLSLRHPITVYSAVFSPDGGLIATGDSIGHVRYWDARTGERIGPAYEHTNIIESIQFSRDGKEVVTASFDGTARIWPVPQGSIGGDARRVNLWVQSLTAMKFDTDESIQPLEAVEWKETRRALEQLGLPPHSP